MTEMENRIEIALKKAHIKEWVKYWEETIEGKLPLDEKEKACYD